MLRPTHRALWNLDEEIAREQRSRRGDKPSSFPLGSFPHRAVETHLLAREVVLRAAQTARLQPREVPVVQILGRCPTPADAARHAQKLPSMDYFAPKPVAITAIVRRMMWRSIPMV